jgi:hypothetical protein
MTTVGYNIIMTAARIVADFKNLESQSSTETPFTIRAATGQTADLLQIKNNSGSVVAKIDSAGEFVHPGSVIQVLNVTKTDAQIISGALWNDISGLSLSITPRYASSRILVIADVKAAANTDTSVIRSRVLRDSTPVGIGDAASNRPRSLSQFYMTSAAGDFYVAQLGGNVWDSPNTTSSVTYKVQLGADGNSQTVFINRTEGDRDTTYYDGRFISSITLMEIAQ